MADITPEHIRATAYRIREIFLAVIAATAAQHGENANIRHTTEVRRHNTDCYEVIVWRYREDRLHRHVKDGYGVIIAPEITEAELFRQIIKFIYRIGEETE